MGECIVLTILLFLLFLSFYILHRNNKVYDFCMMLSKMSYNYNMRRIDEGRYDETDAYEWFAEKYTYFRFLYSFKPLKLEKWFTEEELSTINK